MISEPILPHLIILLALQENQCQHFVVIKNDNLILKTNSLTCTKNYRKDDYSFLIIVIIDVNHKISFKFRKIKPSQFSVVMKTVTRADNDHWHERELSPLCSAHLSCVSRVKKSTNLF